ncbi:MAG: metallophosphatase, partial [Lachnospiraceae bacterium]|nr:metallophosphatase [Lachnospiraceae bacterium]
MNRKIISRSFLIFAILFVTVVSALVLNKDIFAKGDGAKTVDILFTSDIHSYLDSYKVELGNGIVQDIGGMARLSTVIREQKAKNPDTLMIDGGDIAIGTLYQTLYAEEALELRMLGTLGFDATTLGNHDFDYSTEKLCSMFENAAAKSDYLPAFVVSNIDWTDNNQDTKDIYEAASKAGLAEYIVTDKGGVKIAVFGIFGKEATSDSPTLTLTVMDQIETARAVVEKIKQNENVDMIVCISHSGINEKIDKSEDEQLAMAVSEIDVILSAHCHLLCPHPIQHGDTWIIGAGCYGEYTGLC